MKYLYTLTAVAIANLIGVVLIANLSTGKVAGISVSVFPTPTPIIVIKKVVKKVYVTAKPAALVLNNTNNQNLSPTTQQPQAPGPAQPNNPSPTSPPAPAPAPQPTVGCMISVDGANYDVTNFRNQHSGGNIFNCGTDMSQIFWGQHNSSILSKMQKYRI